MKTRAKQYLFFHFFRGVAQAARCAVNLLLDGLQQASGRCVCGSPLRFGYLGTSNALWYCIRCMADFGENY